METIFPIVAASVKIEVLPSRGEHLPLLFPHQNEIAMGILVILSKRFMRAMAKPEGIFTEAQIYLYLNFAVRSGHIISGFTFDDELP